MVKMWLLIGRIKITITHGHYRFRDRQWLDRRDCFELKLDSAEFNRRPGLKYD